MSTDVSSPLIPPEWAPQSTLWIGWPRLPEEWGGAFDAARADIAEFARIAAGCLPVRLAIGDAAAEHAACAMVDPSAGLARVPSGDIWLRDTGPIFGLDAAGQRVAHCFRFNGWGGKYVMPGDTETAAALAGEEGAHVIHHDFVLEGGAVDHDGTGTFLTTRECLLNPNRNVGWSEADAERALEGALGARRMVWLDKGLVNDHTDGHVDNIARFIGPGRAICQAPSGPEDPHRERLLAAEDALRSAGLETVTIPSPGRIENPEGEPLPASHMNFVFANDTLILPVYEAASGQAAAAALAEALPSWRIMPLSSRAILAGGGSFHCMTREVPALSEVTS